jgi:3-phosphoinositide dependent protein kinase-1
MFLKDKKYLYFVLDLASNGELHTMLRREGNIISYFKLIFEVIGKLSIELVKFFAAEMINILEYMHGKGICHRDLKPSNLLFDENYHLKLVLIYC